MRSKILVIFLLAIAATLQFCNDPAFIGADLLKDDEIDLSFVDTFKLEAQTILDTGAITYDPSIPVVLSSLPVGKFIDPVFGTVDASIYSQFLKSNFVSPPSFVGATLDSIMLYIALDTITPVYGNTIDEHDLEVFKINGTIPYNIRYRSGYYDFPFNPIPIGQLLGSFPDPNKRVRIVEPTDTFDYDPHVAFRLADSYGQYIMNLDSLYYNSDSIFLANVPGLTIQQSNENKRMVVYDINSNYSRLQILYTQGGEKKIYLFPLQQGPRVPQWKQTFSQTITDALYSKEKGNELIYLQSLGGLKAKLEFTNLTLPPNAIINKAELEFTVIELPQDQPSIYTAPTRITLYRKDVNGIFTFISDQGNLADYSLIGGLVSEKVVNGLTVKYYSINISNHIQDILKGRQNPEVYVGIAPNSAENILPLPENLSRVVLGGPKHPEYPCKLKISFTTY